MAAPRGSSRSQVLCPRPRQDQATGYHWKYVELVRDDDVLAALEREGRTTRTLLESVDEERADHRYESGKWSVKEVVGHLLDSERIFAYRALRIGRGDPTPLSGYEQDDYVRAGRFDSRKLSALSEELALARAASLALFRGFDEEAWRQSGTANNMKVLAATFPWLMLGHELHHRAVLIERYL
jgi:uncharacterized damage-inducible protein DinB